MLGDYDVIAFTQTAQPEKAKAFYRDIVGLKLVEDSPFRACILGGEHNASHSESARTYAAAVHCPQLECSRY